MNPFKKHLEAGCRLSIVFGLVTFLCILYYNGWNTANAIRYDGWKICVISIICVAASLFPDIDIEGKGQKIVYAILLAVNLILLVLGKYAECAIFGIVTKMPMVTKRSAILHSYWMAAILPTVFLGFVLRELSPLFLLCWAAAWISYSMHLVSDNKQGTQVSPAI